MTDIVHEYTLAHAWTVTQDTAFWCLVGMCGIFLTDVLLARSYKARYFFCHSIINGIITILVIPDSYWLLSDPLAALQVKSCSSAPLGLVFAIHFYHMIGAFIPKAYGGFKLYPVDWLHHILMVVLGCPAIMFAAMGPCVNFNFLFVCGIPGGLDYYMLVRVKEGTMKSLDEKSINTNLNVWCRCPFLVSTVVLIFVQTHMHQPPIHIVCLRIFCCIINWWNGLYFMERVVSNYYVTHHKLKDALTKKGGEAMVGKMANVKKMKTEKVLIDQPEDHPLPSAPMHPRVMKTKAGKNVWEFIRAGS
jgi:hypothetical protein